MKNKKQKLQFTTNINCSGCIATLKPHLDNAQGICHWEVDISNKDKILIVQSGGITKEQVIATVQNAGYRIELLNA